MPKQTLLDLSTDVTRLLVAGAAQAPGDDGLRRRAQRLRELGKQVPALVPIADAVDKVLNAPPRNAASALLDLSGIVRQVRAGLAGSGVSGPLEPLPDGTWATPTPQRDVATLLDLLNGAVPQGTNRLEQLREAIGRNALGDLRLVQPLVQALTDGHAAFAELVATQALPVFGPQVVPFLEAQLDRKHKGCGGTGRLLAICSIDPIRGKLLCLQALEVGNEPLKVRALECLGTLDPQVAEQVAMKYLSDSKAELRAAAVVAVAGLPKDEVLEAIVGFLEDTKEVWASVKMCLGLRKFAHPGITSRFERELKKAIADWDAVPGPMPQTKNKPAKTAAKPRVSGQERERKRLQERIVRLVNELCCSPDRQATADMLIGLASHPVADLRFAAVLGLGTAGTGQWKKVVPVLTAALKDKNPAVIDAATAALGHLAPESAEAVSELLKVIQNDKLKVELRMAAARGASNAPNDRRVLPMFMQMIKQDGGPVVWNSMTTLDPSGAQAIPAMIALLTSKKPELVSGALAVLIRYREKAAAARSAVAALLEHKSQRIRTQANALLDFLK